MNTENRNSRADVAAIDIGASSGRVIVITLENQIVKTTEVYRFMNQ